MMIHTVRSPFMSRLGQFEKDKQTLCIGLDLLTVEKNKSFLCYLGKNKKTWYEIDSAKAFSLSEKYGSRWTNPKKKEVLILPLKDFTQHRSKWDKDKYEEKEVVRAKKIEELTLF